MSINWFTQSPLSLKIKLPLCIVTFVVITFTISTVFTFFTFTSVVNSVKESHLKATAQNIGESISTQIRQAGRDMVMVASLPNVLQSIEIPPIKKGRPEHNALRTSLTNLFERILLSYGYYNAFYMVNDYGEFILGTTPTARNLIEGKESVPFKDARRAGGFHIGPTQYNDTVHRALVPIFLEVVYNGYGGTLVSSLHITKIANAAIQSVTHPEILTHIIAVSDGDIIPIASEGDFILPKGSWMEALQKSPSGVFNIEFNNHTYTMGFHHIAQTDIYAITLAESDFMSAPSTILRNTTLLTNSVAVIIIMLFLYYMIMPIMREITQLSLFARAVTKGKQNTFISTVRNDELGELAHSLDTMVTRLKDMVQRSEAATKAKSDFLACMSHEIRTPMNGILGMTHLALQANPDKKQKDFLHRIDTAAKTLLGVINDILDFSKIEAEKLDINTVTFRISGILASMRDMLEERCQAKGLALHFTVEDTVPDIIHSDPLRFAQICINLCSNAIKFTSHGTVKMHISLKEKQDDYIILAVAVTDTGIGIAPEDQAKIFDSFSQVDGTTTRKYGGTGLGLAISKNLTRLLGGTIWVESAIGQGSTFAFTIRAQEGCETQLEEKDFAHVVQSSLPPLNILLVEDNEINQEIALEVLKSMGAHVTLATNGAEGLATFLDNSFDLILMDIQMPIMDGITATKNIRSSTHPKAQTIPIIAMTAHAMTGDKEKSLEAGMNDHITKPIDVNELHNTLLKWGAGIQLKNIS